MSKILNFCFVLALLSASCLGAATRADANTVAKHRLSDSANNINMTAPQASRTMLTHSKPVTASHGMVVTAQHVASQVGRRILKDGGNAIDAAVAVGYALAVVHPCCGNIGGGGFLVAHLVANNQHQAKNVFLDFREKAPLQATQTMYQKQNGKVDHHRIYQTYLGTGVPGTVMGLEKARKQYGTMSRQQLITPAIKLARNGYKLTKGDVQFLHDNTKRFKKRPNAATIFLNHGQPYHAGDVLKQPQLAHTLSLIRKNGAKAFYHGQIAKRIVRASHKHGGILSMKDFAKYTAPWGKPIRCDYRGNTVLSTPPPSSGGTTICEILGILKPFPLAKWGYGSVQTSHDLIEAERRAFADRNTYLGDPAFVHNPIKKLLSKSHLAALRQTIQPHQATPSNQIKGSLGPRGGRHTTQYSIVDSHGNAVSVTYTLNRFFGTGYVPAGTGVLLNDEMGDFTAKPGVPNQFGLVQGKVNDIQPGKRPLSSMAPSIVLKNGAAFIVTGSPGGPTIISTTLESMLNVIDFGFNIQQAVNAPRLHNQWLPDVTIVQPGYLTPHVRKQLKAMGHHFKTASFGADEAILLKPKSGRLEGANDRRRSSGLAAGY